MKLLIVDDDSAKAEAIAQALQDALGESRQNSITTVSTLASAVRVLNVVAFDLIILDLMLPYLEGGDVDGRAGLELLKEVRTNDGPNKSTAVIGISAFPEEVAAFRSQFEEFGVLITKFDDQGSWSRTLLRVLREVGTRISNRIELDFVIFCALEEERAGYSKTKFKKESEAIVSGLNVHYVRLEGERSLFGVIVRLSQMGLVAATFEAAAALNAFRTNILCMSGICAGFSKQANLGQLIVASPAWEYQAGKWSQNGFEIAPTQIQLNATTRGIIDQVISRENFVGFLEEGFSGNRPMRQSMPMRAPFATGSAVIADPERLKHIEPQHRKLSGLDMETFGLYFVAHELSSAMRHFFSIKCIVDFADANKDDNLHDYGCLVSARATEQIIRALIDSDG